MPEPQAKTTRPWCVWDSDMRRVHTFETEEAARRWRARYAPDQWVMRREGNFYHVVKEGDEDERRE